MLNATVVAGNKGIIVDQNGAFETDLDLEYHWFLLFMVGYYMVKFINIPTDEKLIDFGEIKMVRNHLGDHMVVGGPPSDEYDPVKQKEQDEKVRKEVLRKYRIKVNGKKTKTLLFRTYVNFRF